MLYINSFQILPERISSTSFSKSNIFPWISVRFEFEATSGIYNSWLKWKAMPYPEKIEIRTKWENYYGQCRNTPEAALYRKAAAALKEGRTSIVRECGQEASKRLEQGGWLPTPSKYDPDTLEKQLKSYFNEKELMESYKKIIEEHRPVYGKKGQSDDLL